MRQAGSENKNLGEAGSAISRHPTWETHSLCVIEGKQAKSLSIHANDQFPCTNRSFVTSYE